MQLIEHWWNSEAARFARQDIFLRRNPAGQFEVELCTEGRSVWREYSSEQDARSIFAALRAGVEGWREVRSSYAHDRVG